MKITKKKIAKDTKVQKYALQQSIKADYRYTYETERYIFSANTKDTTLEVWDKKHVPAIDSYPGTYHTFDGHKKDFVDFVYWYLIDNQN